MTRLLHQPFGFLHRPMGGLRSQVGLPYAEKVIDYLGSSNVIQYLKMDETSGTTAVDSSAEGNDGVYTGATLNNSAAPVGIGGNVPLFDGSNDNLNIYSAGLSADFSGAEGTFIIWAKVAGSAVWTDGTSDFMVQFRVDANNFIQLQKASSASNRVTAQYKAGGTAELHTKDSLSTTDWMMWALTWSAGADEFKIFYNGAVETPTFTTLGTWAGALSSAVNNNVIGEFQSNSVVAPWNGYLCHACLMKAAATEAQILQVYNWGIGA